MPNQIRPAAAVPLNADAIQQAMSPLAADLLDGLEVFDSVPSTNSYLLEQPIGASRARVCLAESQPAGRGRRGNRWQSAPNRNLMMSFSWGFETWPDTVTGLGLAIALVLVERLNQEFELEAKIKWPNDILIGNKKLGGILIDVVGESDSGCQVVVGIGVNIHQPDWPAAQIGGVETMPYLWQDLMSLGITIDRNQLAAVLLSDLLEMVSGFERTGFEPLRQHWNKMSSYSGKRIRVGENIDQGGLAIEGKMQGVDEHGALLLLDDNNKQHRFADSNVSVRLLV